MPNIVTSPRKVQKVNSFDVILAGEIFSDSSLTHKRELVIPYQQGFTNFNEIEMEVSFLGIKLTYCFPYHHLVVILERHFLVSL